MRSILRGLVRLAVLGALTVGVAGCGEPPPPEGFHLRLRFVSIDPSVIDRVNVAIVPQGDDTFMMVEPLTYADGAIQFEVATDGAAEIRIDGDYVRSLTDVDPSGTSHTFDLEVYSDDSATHTPPLVSVFVEREGNTIAQAQLYLPQWPLPLGGQTTIQVPCSAGMADRCFP